MALNYYTDTREDTLGEKLPRGDTLERQQLLSTTDTSLRC